MELDATLADFGIDASPCVTDQERSPTLHHLLTSCSGVYLALHSGSTYDIFRNRPSDWPQRGSAAPGVEFHYSDWDFNVLGEIYQRVSGVALFAATDGILARPLGFRDWNPLEHARLRHGCDALGATPRYPNYAMQLSARDLARFGSFISMTGHGKAAKSCRPTGSAQARRPGSKPFCPTHSGHMATFGGPSTTATRSPCYPGATRLSGLGDRRFSDPVATDGGRCTAREPGWRVSADGTPDRHHRRRSATLTYRKVRLRARRPRAGLQRVVGWVDVSPIA